MASTKVDYSDKRFTEVENQKNQALSDLEKTYGGNQISIIKHR